MLIQSVKVERDVLSLVGGVGNLHDNLTLLLVVPNHVGSPLPSVHVGKERSVGSYIY